MMDTKQHDPDDYITVPEAAAMLGVSRQTFSEMLDRGKIEHIRPVKQRRVKVGDVLQFRDGIRRRGVRKLLPELENALD